MIPGSQEDISRTCDALVAASAAAGLPVIKQDIPPEIQRDPFDAAYFFGEHNAQRLVFVKVRRRQLLTFDEDAGSIYTEVTLHIHEPAKRHETEIDVMGWPPMDPWTSEWAEWLVGEIKIHIKKDGAS